MIEIVMEGDRQMAATLQQLGAGALPVIAQQLRTEGEAIVADAKANYVPVDTGVLRASGFVEGPVSAGPEAVVEVGFGGPAAPYALSVHENPRAGRTFGLGPVHHGRQATYRHYAQVGMWKYLETPWKAAAPAIMEHLGEALEAAVMELGHS